MQWRCVDAWSIWTRMYCSVLAIISMKQVTVISDYTAFCHDMIIPKKPIKSFPNSKYMRGIDLHFDLQLGHHAQSSLFCFYLGYPALIKGLTLRSAGLQVCLNERHALDLHETEIAH